MSEPGRLRQGEGDRACDDKVSKVLGIAPSSAYELMHEKGFPVLKSENRLLVPKAQFIKWVEENTGGSD